MVQKTLESSEGQEIANVLVENVIKDALRTVGVRTSPRTTIEANYESFEGLKLQTYGTDDILDSVTLKTGSIEKIKEIENTEAVNINPHMSEVIFPSLPELCCSLSTTSKHGEGDFQHNTIREAAAFYQLGQFHRQTSTSSMITETSNSDISDMLKNKINNLSFDAIQLSDSEADDSFVKPPGYLDSNNFLNIPGQVCSEVEITDKEREQCFLQQSQKFCQYNNKQYLPLNTDFCPLTNEYCDEESEVQDMDEKRELLSVSSSELVNVEGDFEERLIPVKRFLQKNPIICSTTQSSLNLPSPCFPDTLSLESEKDMNTINVKADVEPVKEIRNWEEAVEVQINVTEPLKSDSQNECQHSDVVKTKTFLSSVGLMSEHQMDPSYIGPVDVPGIESIPGVRRVELKYPMKESDDEIWVVERATDDEDEPASSNKDLNVNADVNYLSFADKTEKEKKKNNFATRIASGIFNLLRSKKRNKKKL